MREFTAGTMTVLGALLVLAGLAVIVLGAVSAPGDPDATTEVAPAGTGTRLVRAAREMPASAFRLFLWGVVLLALAAIASGAIGIEVKAAANTP